MNRRLVSVIIPSYNYAEYICEAVDSALAQTCPPIEIIVVDSGSDDTRQRLSKYGDRICYLYQSPRGLSAARNLAIAQVRGEWIALLDADDVWHPEKLAVQFRAAQAFPDCALIGSASVDELPRSLPGLPESRRLGVADFLGPLPFGPSGVLIRRASFDATGLFDESLPAVEDRDMWLRVAAEFPCLLVDSPCWWYRTHPAQMSRHAARNYENHQRVLAKFFRAHPDQGRLRRRSLSYMHADAAWCYFAEGNRKAAMVHLFRSFFYFPGAYQHMSRDRHWWRLRCFLRFVLGTRLLQRLRPGVR